LAPKATEVVVSANVGCIAHLQAGANVPVRHWLEVLDDALSAAAPSV
jgi:glycolate oxidase iron-sulfur subunit